jgi:type IV pilus biogenesis protein CpaD/CtpE
LARSPTPSPRRRFAGSRWHDDAEVRRALDLDASRPIVRCDARVRESSRDVLVTLVDHTIVAAESGVRIQSPTGSPF